MSRRRPHELFDTLSRIGRWMDAADKDGPTPYIRRVLDNAWTDLRLYVCRREGVSGDEANKLLWSGYLEQRIAKIIAERYGRA